MGSSAGRRWSRPAEEESGAYCSCFCVGAVSVEVAGRCSDDVMLVPSLRPFRVGRGAPDINIRVEWVSALGPAVGRRLFDSGTTWRLYEDAAGFQFDISAPVFGERPYKKLLVDRRFRHATLQMSEESFAGSRCAARPLEYPLDELLIMHRLTQEKAIELHSCGIVRPDGTGNLFVGHSGAGKSTTTRLWTAREDVEVLSDDRIIVRRDGGWSDEETTCEGTGGAGEQQVLRLRDCFASRSNHSAQDDRAQKQIPRSARNDRKFAQSDREFTGNDKGQMRMYGTPWHGEAAYASPGSAPLARIFVLEHGRGNVLTRLSPSQAVGELFARSFVPFHRHEYVDSALEFLQELVSAVPCYHYAFEPNEAAVERILNFRD